MGKKYKNLDPLTEEAFDFARFSLLIFIGLGKIDYIEKNDFLTLIDYSLLDKDKACELKNSLNEIKKILLWELNNN